MQTLRDPHGSPLVLVVQSDPVERERYGAWLEEVAMTPINCPGPPVPSWTCLGVRGERCPLAAVADIVVLDATGLPGISKTSAAGWKLLRHYLAAGKPVVVIADNYRKDRSFRARAGRRPSAKTRERVPEARRQDDAEGGPEMVTSSLHGEVCGLPPTV